MLERITTAYSRILGFTPGPGGAVTAFVIAAVVTFLIAPLVLIFPADRHRAIVTRAADVAGGNVDYLGCHHSQFLSLPQVTYPRQGFENARQLLVAPRLLILPYTHDTGRLNSTANRGRAATRQRINGAVPPGAPQG